MPEFKPEQPVFIKESFPIGKGSIMPVDPNRPYRLEQIPLEYRNEKFIHQPVGKKFLKPEKSALEPIVPAITQINVNVVPQSELIKLKHVGTATAEQIIKEREKQLFSSIEDLQKRAPIPANSGGSWADLKDMIRFI